MPKTSIILGAAVLVCGFTAGTPLFAKEPAKQTKQPVPLITDVMTKEEIGAYLKEKGIPIITKAEFKEPELVWERTFNDGVQDISDITEKGNSIVRTGQFADTTDKSRNPVPKMLFLDSKGETRKVIDLKKADADVANFAKSGKAAFIEKYDEKKKIVTISYFDEEGTKLWDSKIKVKEFGRATISDNGGALAISEINPKWSEEEWDIGNLNVSRLVFLDKTGKQVFEYKGYRNMSWGKFSGDDKYFAGLFWWQKDFKVWGKLVYANLAEGKIVWEKPFGGNTFGLSVAYEGDGEIAISENGSYVAVMDKSKVSFGEKHDPNDYEAVVFNLKGDIIARAKAREILWLAENWQLFIVHDSEAKLIDIFKNKYVLKPKKPAFKTARRPVPNYPDIYSDRVVQSEETLRGFDSRRQVVFSFRMQDEKATEMIRNLRGELLFERYFSNGLVYYTRDGRYLRIKKRENNKDRVSIYTLKICGM